MGKDDGDNASSAAALRLYERGPHRQMLPVTVAMCAFVCRSLCWCPFLCKAALLFTESRITVKNLCKNFIFLTKCKCQALNIMRRKKIKMTSAFLLCSKVDGITCACLQKIYFLNFLLLDVRLCVWMRMFY